MNTGIGLTLFFLGAFALIVAMVSIPSIQFYTGGAFVGLFMAGLFYAWGNAWRQTKRLEETQSSIQGAPEQSAMIEQPQAENKS
jgi:hypothetical protein